MLCKVKKEQYVEFYLISKYRNYIMGVAAIMIILCHNTLIAEQQPWNMIFDFSRHFFQIGVDIFLLVSGIGCVFSYVKDENSIVKFYRKRFARILPTYIIAIALWGAFSLLVGWESGSDFLWDYSIISFYIDGSGKEWYVSAILLLYLVFPFLYSVLRKNARLYYNMVIGICIISFILSFICRKATFNEIFAVRIPIYMIGIYIGYNLIGKRDKKIQISRVMALFLICVGLILVNYVFNSYNKWWITRMLFIPTTLSFCLIIAWRMKCKEQSKLKKLVAQYGSYTLENYLLNEKVLTIFACTVYRFINKPIVTPLLVNTLGAIFTIVASILLSRIVKFLMHGAQRLVLRLNS